MVSFAGSIYNMAQMNLSGNRNRVTGIENRCVIAKAREVGGVGWTGSLGLVDANYYIKNG